MPEGIEVAPCEERGAIDLAAHSRGALDAPLSGPARLQVSIVRDRALMVGAFQRGVGLPDTWPLFRRGSGGPEVLVGPRTVHVALSLSHPGALGGADARRIVNRFVRPLLRALTRIGHAAQFFGRDWVSVGHQPAAWVGFAHDSSTGRTMFEAFVATASPFAIAQRPSFRGKAHTTLDEIARRSIDPEGLARSIVAAYVDGYERTTVAAAAAAPLATDPPDDIGDDPPWMATREEAIGWLGAGPDQRGVFRVGGDLLVSRDAIARLESSIAAGGPDASDVVLGHLVDATLGAPEVAVDGIRHLASVRDVISRALGAMRGLGAAYPRG
jgi:hypothetical protein